MPNKIDFFPCICGGKVKGSAYSSKTMCRRKGCTRYEELRAFLGLETAGNRKLRQFVESVLYEDDPAIQREMIQEGLQQPITEEVRQYFWNWLHLY